MFGLFRRHEYAPLEIEADMDIDRPAGAVFALLDMSTPRNAMSERGHYVRADEEIAGRFYADDPGDPMLGYVIDVEEAEAPRRFVARVSFAGGRAVGVLLRERSIYTVTPASELPNGDAGGEVCRVKLNSTLTLVPRLSERKYRRHHALLITAVWNDLVRLKIHAEQGAEAARKAQL